MDFITKFPKSENSSIRENYNSILVVLNKFTKYTYLIPYKEKSTIKQMTWIILNRVIRYHDILKSIIADRDKIFISNFWRILMTDIGTKTKLSTAYYPQTDKQIERMNQILETYLHYYVNYNQWNCLQLLLMVQLVLNNRTIITIDETAFYANHGRYPNLFNVLRESPQAEIIL